ncbi:flagellar biosynthetic protein FliR [Vibrio vulnificus]|nr:flagellar biosynthetic protein FliR [Vibrio vulnificus]
MSVSETIFLFSLVLARITPVLIFKSINPISILPVYLKLILTLVITFLIIGTGIDSTGIDLVDDELDIGFVLTSLLTEAFIGSVLWFALVAAYGALVTMLTLLDMQVGFNPMGVFNPSTSESDPNLARVVLIFFYLMFFITDIHHQLIEFLVGTLRVYPILSGIGDVSIRQLLAIFFAQFVLAMMLIIPVVMAIFWVELIFGMCNRMMPQVNIYFVGLPVKILIAIIVLSHSANHVVVVTESMFNKMLEFFYSIF